MRKPKKNYAAIFNDVALAKAHQMPSEVHTPERSDPEDARGIFRVGREIFRSIGEVKEFLQWHGMKKTDTPFDYISTHRAWETVPVPANAYPVSLINQPVDRGHDLVLQQYLFFVVVNDFPNQELGRTLADPMEYYTYLIWRILSSMGGGGKFQTYYKLGADGVAWGPRLHDGFIALTQDPSKFDPMQKVHIIIPAGQFLVVECDQLQPGIPGNLRTPYDLGCRVRGFFRSKT